MKFKLSWLKYFMHAAVLIGVVWAAVKTINGDEFHRALEAFDWRVAPLVCLLGLSSVVIKGWRFGTLLKQVHEISRSVAMKAYVAGQSMTLLPGGIAARSGMLTQVGIKVEESAPAIALSSFCDQIGFIVCGLVAAFFFEQARKTVFIFLAVLAVVALILGIEASRTWLMNVIEKILRRFHLDQKWQKFIETMSSTLSLRVVAVGVGNSLMSFAVLVAALYLCMRGVGHSLPIMTLLLAYTIPTMAGRISALPGGVGLTEVGMVSVLDHAPGVTLDQAAVAVMIFRLSTVLFSALCGGIIYWTAWRKVADQGEAVVSN
jgi:uncharacterized protein (TIRG00374 family)